MLESIRNSAQSIWVKIAFALIIGVFIFWGIGSNPMGTGAVASVNGVDITEQEFAVMYNQQVERIRASVPDITLEQLEQMQFSYIVLESLIAQSLLRQESARTGIDISPRELFNLISTFPFTHDQDGKFSAEIYKEALASVRQTPKYFEDNLKKEMLEEKFRNLFQNFTYVSPLQARQLYDYQYEKRAFDYLFVANSEFLNEVNPTEVDLQKLYEETRAQYKMPASIDLEFIEVTPAKLANTTNITDEAIFAEYEKNKSKYDKPETVTASHILLRLDENASEEEEKKVLAEINDIRAKIDSGIDFEELARMHSADLYSAQNGGSLGAFGRGQMVTPFEEVAFSQPIGSISEPVRTRFGYHIIRVDSKEEAQALKDAELKEVIGKELAEFEAMGKIQSVLDSLIIQAHASKDENPLEKAAQSEGLIVESTGLIPLHYLAGMYQIKSSDIQLLEQMEKGALLSSPLATNNGFLVARIKETFKERERSFDEVKEELIALVKNDLAHEKALEKAQEDLKSIDTVNVNLLQRNEMARNGAFELGDNVELAQTLFSAPKNNTSWLNKPYAVENGYVLVKPLDFIPVNEDEWNARKEVLLSQMRMSRDNMLYAMYTQNLRENAEIKILNYAYFQ